MNCLFQKIDRDLSNHLSHDEFPKPKLFLFFDRNQGGMVSRDEGIKGIQNLK